jgi:endoglucanase
MRRAHRVFLEKLLSQPTAPFREAHVVAAVRTELARHNVPHFSDPHGNVVIGCRSAAEYRRLVRERSDEPLRLLIAHMDHPGFHGSRWLSSTRLAIRWHGGSPTRHLSGARVWLADDSGYVGEGRLARVRLRRSRYALASAEVRLSRPLPEPKAARTLFGGFAFRAPVWRAGRRLYTKAADDLVGAFAVVSTAIDLFAQRQRTRPPFLGLLTRAEEVGFVGAIAHLELGWLSDARRPLLAVSLETSRTLPGALVARGPIVRLGDRRSVFDPGATQLLTEIGQHVLPKRHQRRIMDGGTCEATAALAFGLPAIGLSVPLGNYHNEAFEGAPGIEARRGPAPEFVHLDDVEGLLRLCRALFERRLPWSEPWRTVRRRLVKNRGRYRRLLDDTPAIPVRRKSRSLRPAS